MPLPLLYLSVVLIWATTPLAIQWSTISFAPMTALTLRMLISLVLVAGYVWIRRSGHLQLRNWRLYLAASLGIFPTMGLVYGASQFIPSGLISVLFGMAPFMVALCSWVMLRVNSLERIQMLALLLSIAGLGVIFLDHATLGEGAIWGILLTLGSTFLFALSSLLVKKLGVNAVPTEQLFGALLVATPLLILTTLMSGTLEVKAMAWQSVGALLYLSLVGSFIGFLAYFRLVQALDVMLVALIPMITPVLALWLGVTLNAEEISSRLALGSGLIVSGLGLYNYKVFYLARFKRGHRED